MTTPQADSAVVFTPLQGHHNIVIGKNAAPALCVSSFNFIAGKNAAARMVSGRNNIIVGTDMQVPENVNDGVFIACGPGSLTFGDVGPSDDASLVGVVKDVLHNVQGDEWKQAFGPRYPILLQQVSRVCMALYEERVGLCLLKVPTSQQDHKQLLLVQQQEQEQEKKLSASMISTISTISPTLPTLTASPTSPTPTSARKQRVIVIDGLIASGKSTLSRALQAELQRRHKGGVRVFSIAEPVEKWRTLGALDRFYKDPVREAYAFQTFVYVTRIQSVRDAVSKQCSIDAHGDPCVDANDERPPEGATESKENKESQSADALDVFILDRSILTDRFVFMEMQRESVGPQVMAMYETWCDLYKALMPLDLSAATFVYLRPDVDVCMRRLAKRGRPEEKSDDDTKNHNKTAVAEVGGVTREYQARLQAAHDAFFLGHTAATAKAEASNIMTGLRRFPLSSVVHLDGDLANGDFSSPGAERDRIVHEILKRIGL